MVRFNKQINNKLLISSRNQIIKISKKNKEVNEIVNNKVKIKYFKNRLYIIIIFMIC